MQIKSTNHYLKSINGREVTGIFAVHGNVDDGGDRSWPGSFSKTIGERGSRVHLLWQHDMTAPPLAKITMLRELQRNELPSAILERAPDAMGGVEVMREYLDTPRGNEVFEGIKSGVLNEMSYAYDAVKFDFEEKSDVASGRERIRNLREVRLYEVSDVLWGMNPATVGSKSHLPTDLQWVSDYLAGLKAGARHSGSDADMINQIASNALALGATNIKLIGDLADTSNAEHAKSRAEQVEPVSLVGLTHLHHQLMQLEIAMLGD